MELQDGQPCQRGDMTLMETLRVKSPQRPCPASQPLTSATASGATAKHHTISKVLRNILIELLFQDFQFTWMENVDLSELQIRKA